MRQEGLYVVESVVMLLVASGRMRMILGLNIKGTSFAHIIEKVGDFR